MNIKDNIIKNIINPINNTKYDMLVATVTEYDEINNKANVIFNDPNIKAQMLLEDIPVQLGSGGVHSSGPFVGSKVWLSFQNSTPLHPKIIALADENYATNTRENLRHIRKGSLIPFDKNNQPSDIPNGNNINTWIDETNTTDIYTSFKNLNPENDLNDTVSAVFYYNASDPGITHPLNSSTVRIRENGIIDVFVSTNEGIRINPNDKSLNIFSTNLIEDIDTKKINSNSTIINSKSIDLTANNWTITGDNLSIKITNDINIECKNFNIHGNLNKVGE